MEKKSRELQGYDDIIDLPHHVSNTHPHMKICERAAQFSPFAALTGYEAAIKETGRLTDQKMILDECEKEIINQKLWILKENIEEKPKVSITYFVKDERKDGGKYVTDIIRVKKLDLYKNYLVGEKNRISFSDIIEIEGDIFSEYEKK